MKNNCISILAGFMLSFTLSHAQKSFEKGSKLIEPGIGLGLYKTEFTDKRITNAVVEKDTAGAVFYPIGFEYGLLDWLGCGGKFSYSNYLTNDSTSSSEKVRGIDMAAFVRAHALRTKRIDLFAGIDFGYSHLAYNANNGSEGNIRANGTYFGINLNSRFYFGKRWGLRLFYNLDFYNYPNGTIEDSFNSFKFALKLKSFFLLGGGLMFKLG